MIRSLHSTRNIYGVDIKRSRYTCVDILYMIDVYKSNIIILYNDIKCCKNIYAIFYIIRHYAVISYIYIYTHLWGFHLKAVHCSG